MAKAHLLFNVLSGLVISGSTAHAQLLDRIHIRHNLETRKEVAQPAFFQVTLPKDSAETFTVGAGVKVDLMSTPSLDIGPFMEWQRNTAIDKRQNVFRVGGAGEWQLWEIGKEARTTSPVFLSQINYKRDVVQGTNGLQASLLWTEIFRKEDALLPNSTLSAGDYFDFTYAPYLGLEYEHSGTGVANPSTDRLRGVLRVDIGLYPAGQLIQRRVQLGVSYATRRDLAESFEDTEDNHSLLTIDVNLFFLQDEEKQRQMGVGITYVDGQDPTKGLLDQRYAQLGLKFQI